MRTAPLCRVARSYDGQRWEPLSDEDTRALFDQLARCEELVAAKALRGWTPEFPHDDPAHLVEEVVRRVESGGVAILRLAPGTDLHLTRFEPLGCSPRPGGPLDYALAPDPLTDLSRA